jgi:hypothetical protein
MTACTRWRGCRYGGRAMQSGSLATARLLHWRNPHPDKLIRAVRFVATDPIAGWTLLAT